MRAVIQRVCSARVVVDGTVVGRCEQGMVLLVAAHRGDTCEIVEKFAEKIVNLRIFSDSSGKINLALKDLPNTGEPQILAVSNFTVYGDVKGSRRPSFTESASYEEGEKLYTYFVTRLCELGYVVETGIYGAHMRIELVNDGPVTLVVES